MGHVFSYTHTDLIARFQGLMGSNVVYSVGFDDNGLPTERLVEKNMKIKSHEIPLDEFHSICHNTSVQYMHRFKELFEQMNFCFDWNLQYHTNSTKIRAMSQQSFIDLYKNGNAYRASKPVLWDASDRTAIAQAEIETQEMQSLMNYINFTLENGAILRIATTRPEMLAACCAVLVHPDDERYSDLHNQSIITPIFNTKVPILFDCDVIPDKGTGAVMCCTFGDELDVKWQQRHNLPVQCIISKDGKMIERHDMQKSGISGMSIKKARMIMIELLRDQQFLNSQEEIMHSVKCAERSGSPIEIFPSMQWFIKTLEHKDAILQRTDEISWHPTHMKNKILAWIDGLNQDWCISRQRYSGVPFPVWYDKDGHIIISDDVPIDPRISPREGLTPEMDVMDTWATSALTPSFVSNEVCDLRPQSHEIIRTWALYTILLSHLHHDRIPWHNIMISGWCLAKDKTKMSKSKGNAISPESALKQYGAEPIRYWAARANLGTDTAYSEDIVRNGKKLVNKIKNAAKFVSMVSNNTAYEQIQISEVMDHWILSKLNHAISDATQHFQKFDYCNALRSIEQFFWSSFCDNYLELVKARAYGTQKCFTSEHNVSALSALNHLLKCIVSMFHPFFPISTTEISKDMLFSLQWPDQLECDADNDIGDEIILALERVRKLKSAHNLSMKAQISCLKITSNIDISSGLMDLQHTANAQSIQFSHGEITKIECEF